MFFGTIEAEIELEQRHNLRKPFCNCMKCLFMICHTKCMGSQMAVQPRDSRRFKHRHQFK